MYLHDLFQASINTGRKTAPQLTWSLDSGQAGREGAGCPLRWEDETRGPLCQQLLRHLFSPAFGGLPPPASEQPCLFSSAGTGGLTPARGSTAPASTCLVLAAERFQHRCWVWGGQQRVGEQHRTFHASLASNAVPGLPGREWTGHPVTRCPSSARKEGSSFQPLCVSHTVKGSPSLA